MNKLISLINDDLKKSYNKECNRAYKNLKHVTDKSKIIKKGDWYRITNSNLIGLNGKPVNLAITTTKYVKKIIEELL